MSDKKITVYAGQSIFVKTQQLHPIDEVLKAERLVREYIKGPSNLEAFSNSQDFISAIYHYAKKKNVPVVFYLNGKSCGNSIEPIFEDFNRALKLIHDISQ